MTYHIDASDTTILILCSTCNWRHIDTTEASAIKQGELHRTVHHWNGRVGGKAQATPATEGAKV